MLIRYTYSPEVQKVAEEYGVSYVGYGFDIRECAPTGNMTSVVGAWGWYFVQQVNALAAGRWERKAYLGKVAKKEFGDGIVDSAPYNRDQIPTIIAATSMRSRVRFIETKRDAFEGPIKAQNGVEVLPKGEQFNDEYIYNEMDWFVEELVGEALGEPPSPE